MDLYMALTLRIREKTPLVIIELKKDGVITERERARVQPEDTLDLYVRAIKYAAEADADEAIIRVLRPTRE